jgi:hypothetical protein
MVAFKNVASRGNHQPEQIDLQGIPGVDVLTPAEGRALFDRKAQEMLGISGEVFLQRLDAGFYAEMPDNAEHRHVDRLIMMLPFARPTHR